MSRSKLRFFHGVGFEAGWWKLEIGEPSVTPGGEIKDSCSPVNSMGAILLLEGTF